MTVTDSGTRRCEFSEIKMLLIDRVSSEKKPAFMASATNEDGYAARDL